MVSKFGETLKTPVFPQKPFHKFWYVSTGRHNAPFKNKNKVFILQISLQKTTTHRVIKWKFLKGTFAAKENYCYIFNNQIKGLSLRPNKRTANYIKLPIKGLHATQNSSETH